MSKNKKGVLKSLILGQITAIFSSLILLIVTAVAVTNLSLSDDWILIFSLISMCAGILIGSLLAAKMIQKSGLLIGISSGVIFFALTTIAAFFASGGEPLTTITLIRLLLILICSALGGIVGVNIEPKKKML